MIICPNLKNPDVAREFNELVQATSEKAAYYIWSLNNGNTIDKAPNGASSKLFQSLLDYYGGNRVKAIQAKAKTYSKSFLNWFGDWLNNPSNASKAVDNNGEPLIVYHYSDNQTLTKFSTDFDNYFSQSGGTKKAIFFTEDNPNEEERGSNFLTKRKNKIAAFLNIKDLKIYKGTKEDLHNQGTDYREIVNKSAEENDVDGGVHMEDFDDNKKEHQSIWIIHNSNQVKSVDNQGTFSTANNDIYMMRSNEIYNGFNPYKLKQIGCIVLYGKVSQNFDSYLKKSRGVYPTKFYDSSKNLLYVKSNNRKNSIRYDVVDVNSGEIYVRGLPLYTKDQYDELLSKNRSINKEIDKNWKPYDNHSFAFRKFLNTPSKGLFKFAAKQYLKEATSLEKGAKINYTELIDRFVDNFSDDFWKYIITNTLELSAFGTQEGLTGLLGVTTTIKPWLQANFIFPRGISKKTLIYKLEQKLGIKIRDEENFGIRFNEYTPYNELIKGIRQWYNYYHHNISEEESIALYAKQTDRTVEEVKKYLEVLKEQESMSSSQMRHNILNYSKFDSALMDITKEYNQKYIEYIKQHSDNTLDEQHIGNIFIVFNRDSSPLFMKRLATVLHEPYHALNMLHRRHAAELHEAFKKFYDTSIGKDICLSVVGELVNAGYDANFEEETLANMFAYFMTPVELRGDYTEVPIMNVLSEKLQELEKMPNFQEITQTEDDAEFEKKTKDYTNEQKTILQFFQKLQKAITAFIKKVYTAFSNLINGFIGKQNIQQDVQQNPLQENTDVINAKDVLEDIFSFMYAIMHAPINEGEEILTDYEGDYKEQIDQRLSNTSSILKQLGTDLMEQCK